MARARRPCSSTITGRPSSRRSGRCTAGRWRASATSPLWWSGTPTFRRCRYFSPRPPAPTPYAVTAPSCIQMLGLPDIQTAFRNAMLHEPDPRLLAEIVDDGPGARARLDIYRHHVLTTLTGVLTSAYPVVRRLVDPRFFAYAADCYIRGELPEGPCLHEYGASFPAFLAGFPPCRDLGYLPDVARLEWALHAARHADEAPPLEPSRMAAIPPERTPSLALVVNPSLAYLESPWPIDEIWRANQPERDPASVDLAAGGARLEVRRRADGVVFRALDPPTFAFRQALARGATLTEAAELAFERQGDFPLG